MTAPAHADAFDRAAAYDAHAGVQREVAAWLAGALPALRPGARVLEIGCGTGFVAEAAGPTAADWLMTDIAPAMLARARARLGEGFRYAVMDGEHPAFAAAEAPFDLICGSLVVQWFDDLAAGLARLAALLAPGGRLIVTTLADGSFAEWRAAHVAEDFTAGTPDYPSRAALAALRIDEATVTATARTFVARHADGPGFLHALKAIGAGTPRPGHRPLAPAALRRVLARFEAGGAVARYEVVMLDIARDAA